MRSRSPFASSSTTSSRFSKSDEHGRHPDGRRVRTDALPEETDFRDTGCEFAKSCLSCPFSTCLYEKFARPAVAVAALKSIARLRPTPTHASADALARELGITRRQIYRLQRVKAGLSPLPGLRAASANQA